MRPGGVRKAQQHSTRCTRGSHRRHPSRQHKVEEQRPCYGHTSGESQVRPRTRIRCLDPSMRQGQARRCCGVGQGGPSWCHVRSRPQGRTDRFPLPLVPCHCNRFALAKDAAMALPYIAGEAKAPWLMAPSLPCTLIKAFPVGFLIEDCT